MNFWHRIIYQLRTGNKLYLLITINVVVYLIMYLPSVLAWLLTGVWGETVIGKFAMDYLAMPSDLHFLLHRFWTPITYMFLHAGFWHIAINMLWLYWMGEIFEEYLGKKRILGLYLMGGLAGAFFFVASYNLFPVFRDYVHDSTIVGASAGVMAIVVGAATLLPNYTIPLFLFGAVRLKWIALFFVIFDFLGVAGPNAGGELSHLGGALIGFLYIKRLQQGNDWVASVGKLFSRGPKVANMKVVSRNSGKKHMTKPRQEDVDRVLDKISISGYDSLNKEEKEILFRASKNEG